MRIHNYSSKISNKKIDELTDLLQACVQDGASVGYTDALDQHEAMRDYWERVNELLAAGHYILTVIEVEDQIVAVVGLERCAKPNGKHRGEICKLLVLPRFRRQGLARQLMLAIEAVAWRLNLTLLTLDTTSNGITVDFYQSLGWNIAGEIPQFAQSTRGILEATTVMYKVNE